MTGSRIALAVGLALVLGHASPAAAKSRKNEKYWFSVFQVSLVEGIPAELTEQVRAALVAAIEKHETLLSSLPDGAPDPAKEPAAFKRYLKRKNLRAFKVNLEVTQYSQSVEPMPPPRRGQRLKVSIALRTFGETIPDRVMAFSGEGGSTVMLEIGKKLRKRDSEVANHDAIELAIDEALERSIKKLREPPPAKPTGAKKTRKK